MVIKFKPVTVDKIWGGSKFQTLYNYDTSDKCGECWGISAHKSNSSIISNSKFKGMTLRQLYNSNRELFGNYKEDEFPILVKIIDAKDNLSIQVHPDNEYAKQFGSLGKEECWYILDADPNTEIIIGHKANDKSEIENAINNNSFEYIYNSFPVQKGDFFYIDAGTLHAICTGTTILEVQQSSDITYRLFDYNRLENGKPRDLHLQESLDVLNFPDNKVSRTHKNRFFNYDLITNKITSTNTSSKHGDYIFIIEGTGTFNGVNVKKGDFLMVSSNQEYKVEGNLHYQISTF